MPPISASSSDCLANWDDRSFSLSMQDHFVRVTTDRGSAMVLIRFSDAVRELAGHSGAQVHRSHWVAAGQAKQILHEKNRTDD